MSEFNITVDGGTSKRLLTAGKYCDRDIVITAEGGAEDLNDVLNEQEVLIDELKAVLAEKASGGTLQDYLASRLNDTIKTYKSEEVATIPTYAFYGCNSLETIELPACKTINTACFTNCTSLKSIDFPNCTSIGGTVFRGCTSLTNVNMPLVTGSSTYSFADCSSLKDIRLPQIATVGGAMFQNCPLLEYAYLPNATSIGAMAFQDCASLSSVVIEQTARLCTLAATTAFAGTPIASGTGFIYVPDTLVDEYKTVTNWSTYASQIKPLSELEV